MSTSVSNTYKISYSLDNGSSWVDIVTVLATTTRTYKWTVPNMPTSTNCRIRVADADTICKNDISDASFTITEATPKVLSPNGGEQYQY